MWFGSMSGWIETVQKTNSEWSALQLSAVGSLFFWSARFEASEDFEARQIIMQDGW